MTRFSRYLADPTKELWGRSLASQFVYQDGGASPKTEVSVAAPSAASDVFIRAASFWVNIFFHQIGRFFIHKLVVGLLLTRADSMSTRAPASLIRSVLDEPQSQKLHFIIGQGGLELGDGDHSLLAMLVEVLGDLFHRIAGVTFVGRHGTRH